MMDERTGETGVSDLRMGSTEDIGYNQSLRRPDAVEGRGAAASSLDARLGIRADFLIEFVVLFRRSPANG